MNHQEKIFLALLLSPCLPLCVSLSLSLHQYTTEKEKQGKGESLFTIQPVFTYSEPNFHSIDRGVLRGALPSEGEEGIEEQVISPSFLFDLGPNLPVGQILFQILCLI